MISVSVHVGDSKDPWKAEYNQPDDGCHEYATLKAKFGEHDVTIFFRHSDEVLELITKLNHLHCDWIKCREERGEIDDTVDFGGMG